MNTVAKPRELLSFPGGLGRLAATSLGLSWLYHFSIWQGLYIYYGDQAAYQLSEPRTMTPALSVFLLSVSFAIPLAVLLESTCRLRSPVARIPQFAVLALTALSIWKSSLPVAVAVFFDPSNGYGPLIAYVGHVCTAIGLLWLFVRTPNRMYEIAQLVGIVISPFVLVSSCQLFIWSMREPQPLAESLRQDLPLMAGKQIPNGRVVWILFDELDSAAAFPENRPVPLPAFDRLAREGFSHLRVTPFSHWTLESIPGLTIGMPVTHAEPASPSELLLTVGECKYRWSEQQTIFDFAAKQGREVAIAGWYHPYCRLFPEVLSRCTGVGLEDGGPAVRVNSIASHANIGRAISFHALFEWRVAASRILLEPKSNPEILHPTELPYRRRRHLEDFQHLRADALRYAADAKLDFVFLHLPIPHPYGIFDRRTGAHSLDESANYIDNLVLADKTLAEIRDHIEDAGLTDSTAIVVSSDHPIRDFWRNQPSWSQEMEQTYSARESETVPLFVYTPGAPLQAFEGPLGSLVIYDLLRLLMDGGTPTASDWQAWMQARYGSESAPPIPVQSR